MKTLTDHLTQYAAYHRDRRNIATHMVGIPMIVVAIAALLARAEWHVAGLTVNLAMVAALACVLFYLRLDGRVGALMGLLLSLVVWGVAGVAHAPTSLWLSTSVGLFLVGWVFQFVGHYFEGRKPAFVDDLIGLIVGPLFIVCECLFHLGLLGSVRDAVEARVGPTVIRAAGQPAAAGQGRGGQPS